MRLVLHSLEYSSENEVVSINIVTLHNFDKPPDSIIPPLMSPDSGSGITISPGSDDSGDNLNAGHE